MWKSVTSLFISGGFTSKGLESVLHSFTSDDVFPLFTYPEDSLPQRTVPRSAQGRRDSPALEINCASMPQLTCHIGLRRQPVFAFSAFDILQRHDLREGFWAAPHHAIPQVAACSPVSAVRSFDTRNCHSAVVGCLDHNDAIACGKAEETNTAILTDHRIGALQSIWQVPDLDPLLTECSCGHETFSLITGEDAQESLPWPHLTCHDEDAKNMGYQLLGHAVEMRHEDHSHEQRPGDKPCELPNVVRSEEPPGLEDVSGKRIASYQSSSDASTRRSSIWDDDYNGEIEDDDASEVTDVSVSDNDQHSDLDKVSSTSLDAAEPSSQLGCSHQDLNIPHLQQSNITVLRSPKRRRSSHPALLLLQAENSHLQADHTRLHEEVARHQVVNTQLVSENAHLLSQNTSLRASLTTTTKSSATARDTITTQDLQLHSLRRRISFLERWVDSLHEEKLALHEENMALREVGNARAQAVDDLRESYERLEDVVDKAVGAAKKPHDCLLEIELEGVMGRLGDLSIVS